MGVISILKRFVPASLRPPLRKCVDLIRRESLYDLRIQSELETFDDLNVQDLPPIMHYWSNKYVVPMLAPFGFTDAITCRVSAGNFRGRPCPS